jgi:nitrogenase molybdenum-iron protein beta chain
LTTPFFLTPAITLTHLTMVNSICIPKEFEKELQALLDSSEFGRNAKIWGGKDLWHQRCW